MNNNKNIYKILFSLVYLGIVIMMIKFFNPDTLTKKSDININVDSEKIEEIKDDKEIDININVDSEKIEEIKDDKEIDIKIDNALDVISLDRGLDLLYSDEKDPHVDIRQVSVDEHRRRIKNVKIVGYYDYMDARSMYLDGVEAGGEVYNDVEVMIEGNSRDENVDYTKLKKGNKVEVICTIMKPHNNMKYDQEEGETNKKDFIIFNGYYDDSELNKKTVYIYIDDNTDDGADDKYNNKDKIYDLDEIYDDMVAISNENLERAIKMFNGIKFRVRAKAEECFKVYSGYYLKYKIDNQNNDFANSSDTEKIDGQINFIGTDRNKNESMYFLTKDYFSIELENVLDFERSDFMYQYKDYKMEASYLYANQEIKKGYQDFILSFNVGYTYRINLIRLDENSELYKNDTAVADVFDEKRIKKIGKDEDIDIGDSISFGKNLKWKVIAVDSEDKNKVLIMYDNNNIPQTVMVYDLDDNSKLNKINWSDKDACVYRDSKIREFLINEFYNNYFSNSDKARIYTTKLECKVDNAKNVDKVDYVEDKIFILSDDEIKEYKVFLVNPYLTSFVRNQRYGEKNASMYRRSKVLNDEHKQDTYNLKDKWAIYPAMWINIR